MEQVKEQEPGFLFRLMFLCGICLYFVACASQPEKRVVYEPTANVSDEIRNLRVEMDQAESEQIGAFSPRHYSAAEKSWIKAKALQEGGKDNKLVLEELGKARTHFQEAKKAASITLKEFPEIADARENALIAGAKLYHRPDLVKADDKLEDFVAPFERGQNPKISVNDKLALQQRYLDLELKGIKSTRLGDAKAILDQAKEMGAPRYAPRSWARAQNKFRNAELTINTDRHNDALITAAAKDAQYEANRLMKITQIARKSGRTGNEPMAIDIVDRDEQIRLMNEQMQTSQARARLQQQQAQQRLIEAQRSAASAQQSAGEVSGKLAAQQKINQMYQQAQGQFTKDEADVYRQGDNLIIRLKSIQFPSGRAEVPAASFKVLNKVKDVIADFNAKKITIEGHTDATGEAEFNKELSQQRAEAVAQYLEGDLQTMSGGVEGEAVEIEAQGFGFEYPIVSNRTKEGRATNRRVDIVIFPEFATATE